VLPGTEGQDVDGGLGAEEQDIDGGLGTEEQDIDGGPGTEELDTQLPDFQKHGVVVDRNAEVLPTTGWIPQAQPAINCNINEKTMKHIWRPWQSTQIRCWNFKQSLRPPEPESLNF
jgi:hypothetical protein